MYSGRPTWARDVLPAVDACDGPNVSTVKRTLVAGVLIAALMSACGGHRGSAAGPTSGSQPTTSPPTAVVTTWRALPAHALGPGLTRIVDVASRPSGLVA